MRNFARNLLFATALAVISTHSWAPPFGARPMPHPHPIEIPHPIIPSHELSPGVPQGSDNSIFKGGGKGLEADQAKQLEELFRDVQGDKSARFDPLAARDPLLEEAKRWGAPDEVLHAISARQDQLADVDGLDCCLFRRPWKDWKNHAQRMSEEQNLAQALRHEKLVKAALRFMVLSDSAHVKAAVTGKRGIPSEYRTSDTGTMSLRGILGEIDSIAANAGGEEIELYILAKHEDGQIFLPGGGRVSATEVRDYAKTKGVHLRIWGCNSGLIQSSGIRQSFDALPLIRATGEALRSEAMETRADFLNALHRDTGLEFTFDALDYVAEENLVSAAVYANKKGTQPHREPGGEIGSFELGMPRSYGRTNTAGAASPSTSSPSLAASSGIPMLAPSIAASGSESTDESATASTALVVLFSFVGVAGLVAFAVKRRERARTKATRSARASSH